MITCVFLFYVNIMVMIIQIFKAIILLSTTWRVSIYWVLHAWVTKFMYYLQNDENYSVSNSYFLLIAIAKWKIVHDRFCLQPVGEEEEKKTIVEIHLCLKLFVVIRCLYKQNEQKQIETMDNRLILTAYHFWVRLSITW